MPLGANIIPKSGSGSFAFGLRMTFCRTVLFDEKKEVPDQVGEDNAIGGVTGCSP